MAKPAKWSKGGAKRVWRRLRIEPYNPNARDGDGDGIVQEGTAWERPVGARIFRGSLEIRSGETAPKAQTGEFRVVDKDGAAVDYTPSYARGSGQDDEPDTGLLDQSSQGSSPLSDSGTATLQERGLPSVRGIVQAANEPPPPPVAEEVDDDITPLERFAPSGDIYRSPVSVSDGGESGDGPGSVFFHPDARAADPNLTREPFLFDASEVGDVLSVQDENDRRDLLDAIDTILEEIKADLESDIGLLLSSPYGTRVGNVMSVARMDASSARERDDPNYVSYAISNIDNLINDINLMRDRPYVRGAAHERILEKLGADGLLFGSLNTDGQMNEILAVRRTPELSRVTPLLSDDKRPALPDEEERKSIASMLSEGVKGVQGKVKERTRRRHATVGAMLAEKYDDDEAPWLDPKIKEDFRNALEEGDVEALESWARRVWEHDEDNPIVAPTGMKFRTDVNDVSWNGFQLKVLGTIYIDEEEGEGWEGVGTFERTLSYDGPGLPITLENDLLTLGSKNKLGSDEEGDTRAKGQGFSSLFNGHAFTWLGGMDVESIKITTAWDGPYVWARAGFRQNDKETLSNLARDLEGEINDFETDRPGPGLIRNEEQAKLIRELIAEARSRRFDRDAPQNLEYMIALEDGTDEQRERILDFFRREDRFPKASLDLDEYPKDPRDIYRSLSLDLSGPTSDDKVTLKERLQKRQEKADASLGRYLQERYGDDPAPWDEVTSGLSSRVEEALNSPDLEHDFFHSLAQDLYGIDDFVGRDGMQFRTRIIDPQDPFDDNFSSTGWLTPQYSERGSAFWVVIGSIEVIDPEDGEWKRVGQFQRTHVWRDGAPDKVDNVLLTFDGDPDDRPEPGEERGAINWSTLENIPSQISMDEMFPKSELAEAAKGQGFASAFNGNAFTWAKGMGFERITLETSWDGPYAWPRAGFRGDRDVSENASTVMEYQLELYESRPDLSIIDTDEKATIIRELVDRAREEGYDTYAPQNLEYMLALEGDGDGARKDAVKKFALENLEFPEGALLLRDHPTDARRSVSSPASPAAPGESAKLPSGFSQAAVDRPDLQEPTAPRRPYEPSALPLSGAAQDLADEADGVFSRFMELLDSRGYVVLDYETTGFDVENVPIQVGIVKVLNGEVIDRVNLFMNPDSPLSEWSKENLRDANGDLVTQEWLQGQRSVEDVHREVAEFIGDNIMMAHNVNFDREVLERSTAKAGIDFELAGHIDTLSLLRETIPRGDGETGPERYTLGKLAEFFDVELGDGAHTADADAEATNAMFRAASEFIRDAPTPLGQRDASQDILNRELQETRYRTAMDEYGEARRKYKEDLDAYKQKLTEYQRAIVTGGEIDEPEAPDAPISFRVSDTTPLDPDTVIESQDDSVFNDSSQQAGGGFTVDQERFFTDYLAEQVGSDENWRSPEITFADDGTIATVERNPTRNIDTTGFVDREEIFAIEMKAQLVRFLGSRLEQSGAMEDLEKGGFADSRGFIPSVYIHDTTGRITLQSSQGSMMVREISLNDPNFKTYLAEAIMDEVVGGWAIGAWSDSSPHLQESVAEIFGFSDIMQKRPGGDETDKRVTDAAMAAIAKVMYEETQKMYAAAGTTSVPVHRGMSLEGDWDSFSSGESPNAVFMREIVGSILSSPDFSPDFDAMFEDMSFMELPELVKLIDGLETYSAIDTPYMNSHFDRLANRIETGTVDVEQLTLNPLNSFSMSRVMAQEFEGDNFRPDGSEMIGMVVSANVPVDRVFSAPITGPGAYGESEFVVIGGPPMKARVDYRLSKEMRGSILVDIILSRARALRDEGGFEPLREYEPAVTELQTRDEVVAHLLENVDEIRTAVDDLTDVTGDKILRVLYERQGFGALPNVVDSPDDLPEGRRLFRGVGNESPERAGVSYEQAVTWAEQFRTGDHYPGVGVYGAGSYSSSVRGKVQRMYAHPNDQDADAPRTLLEMSVSFYANILPSSQYEQILETMGLSVFYMLEEMKETADEEQRQRYDFLQRLVKDPGRMAALMGYDGYESNASDVVILNRSAVTVVRDPLS